MTQTGAVPSPWIRPRSARWSSRWATLSVAGPGALRALSPAGARPPRAVSAAATFVGVAAASDGVAPTGDTPARVVPAGMVPLPAGSEDLQPTRLTAASTPTEKEKRRN